MSDTPFDVMKFGGSSLRNVQEILQVCQIIRNHGAPAVVVVSAMAGITDLLLNTAKAALGGHSEAIGQATEQFHARHREVIDGLIQEPAQRESLSQALQLSTDEFGLICRSVLALDELTRKVRARIVARGERLIARILCEILRQSGSAVDHVDACEVIRVIPGPYDHHPDHEGCTQRARAILLPRLQAGVTVIVPGFIAEDKNGELVTLGRGGSDYSAAILGDSLGAGKVVLYKEVDGMMTADPRFVPGARVVSALHYREAAELAYYGAKVLHPQTIIPLIPKQIPLIVKSTFRPDLPGTRISGEVPAQGFPVKALTAILDQVILSVEGKGMMGVPGIAARTFAAMARGGISVLMISQSSSESSICFVVPTQEADAAKELLLTEFREELSHNLLDDIRLIDHAAIIAVIGLGMRGTRGIAARTFTALAREDINIEAIAQGSSELNISFAIDEQQVPRALLSLHQEFQLGQT